MQRINIIFPDEVARDFRRAVPARKRSKFIVDMVKEKLPKRNLKKEFIKSLKANAKFYKDVAEEWKATETEGWPD